MSEPQRTTEHGEALLDNPIWNSLITTHAALALGNGLARRYRHDIGPLAAMESPSPEAYADLARLVPPGDVTVMFLDNPPELLPGWENVRGGRLVQMICRNIPEATPLSDEIVPLTVADFPEMLALATLTEPGPFRANTASLGGFFGIRVDGRLAAMAGRRTAPIGFAEVSAVCTHPDLRGRRYAQALVAAVARDIHSDGSTPFLTSFETNTGAIRVYEQVGFTVRRSFELAVLKLLH